MHRINNANNGNRRRMFFGYLAIFCYKLSFAKQKFLLKYPYLYVICSAESRIIDFGLAHLTGLVPR